jgi:hypothetical protein
MIWKHVQLKSYAFSIPTFWLQEGIDGLAEAPWWCRPPSTETRTCELTGARRSTTRQKGLSIAGKKGRKSDHRSIRKRTALIPTNARKCSSAVVKYQFRGPRSPVPTPRTLTGTRMRFECRGRLPHGASAYHTEANSWYRLTCAINLAPFVY